MGGSSCKRLLFPRRDCVTWGHQTWPLGEADIRGHEPLLTINKPLPYYKVFLSTFIYVYIYIHKCIHDNDLTHLILLYSCAVPRTTDPNLKSPKRKELINLFSTRKSTRSFIICAVSFFLFYDYVLFYCCDVEAGSLVCSHTKLFFSVKRIHS